MSSLSLESVQFPQNTESDLPFVLEASVSNSDHQTKWHQFLAYFQRNAVQRIISAIVLAPLVTVFLWMSPAFATSTVCSFVVSTCSYEYACLSNRIRLRILSKLEALDDDASSGDSADTHSSNEMYISSMRSSLISSQTTEEEVSSRTHLSQTTIRESSDVSEPSGFRGRHSTLRSSQADDPSIQEQREEVIARVSEDFRDQDARLKCKAVSELASVYFYGYEMLASTCVSVVICVISTAVFLLSIEQTKKLHFTDFYKFRWLYSVITSFVAAFCACMSPDKMYAFTVIVQYGVFTAIATYSTGCPMGDFSCGDDLFKPEVAFLIGMLVLLILRLTACRTATRAFLTFMLDVLGLFYISGTLSIFVSFVDDEQRLLYRKLLLVLLYIVWASDTGAYVTGKVLEHVRYPYYNPLAAHLSKNKDYEGTLGAVAFGIGVMAVVSEILEVPGTFRSKVLFTVLAVIVGRVGDLFESLLKRAAGVKDSGKLIPGHGGMLDRIDALMFAALVFSRYYMTGTQRI